ncbi:MAG: hypothetical protein KatS3mg099_203 [Candidatus Parcubacteria bacterium]|nr:MAG: hypothetical protein KatS3mg099_203 [Candidatus Parcubacteria bacterium]
MFSRTLTKLISSRKQGPRVLVVGGMHGNEPVGVRWFEAFQEKLKRGELTLTRGEVHFLLGNPDAFQEGVRHKGFDLNRAFRSSVLAQSPPASTDVARAQEIVRLLEGKQYDAVVDFHSVSRGDVAMVVARVERDDEDASGCSAAGMCQVRFLLLCLPSGRCAGSVYRLGARAFKAQASPTPWSVATTLRSWGLGARGRLRDGSLESGCVWWGARGPRKRRAKRVRNSPGVSGD